MKAPCPVTGIDQGKAVEGVRAGVIQAEDVEVTAAECIGAA